MTSKKIAAGIAGIIGALLMGGCTVPESAAYDKVPGSGPQVTIDRLSDMDRLDSSLLVRKSSTT